MYGKTDMALWIRECDAKFALQMCAARVCMRLSRTERECLANRNYLKKNYPSGFCYLCNYYQYFFFFFLCYYLRIKCKTATKPIPFRFTYFIIYKCK